MSPEYLAFVTARSALDLSGNPSREQESGDHEMQAFIKVGNKSSKHSCEESLQHVQHKMAELDKPEVPRHISVGRSLRSSGPDERHDSSQHLYHHDSE
jgi:hypothetical protein